MRNTKTSNLTIMALMTAVLLIFACTPIGTIPIGPLSISMNMIPVAICAVAMGPAGGAAAGLGVASMAPTALMSIATTFGTASTGTAISTLSGCVAQKAALAWIGRTFAGFAAEGAGMAAGQAFLALAGPIGWGITAVSTGASLISLSNKNKELADKAVNEAKEISIARESLDEVSEKVNSLRAKTDILYTDMDKQRAKILKFLNADYLSLEDEDKYFLGTLVNNTLSLSVLLNETVQ